MLYTLRIILKYYERIKIHENMSASDAISTRRKVKIFFFFFTFQIIRDIFDNIKLNLKIY